METLNEHACVYCLERKPAVQFNREHVLPEGFGGFADALTLAEQQVCRACNDVFGQTLDETLLRDSALGLARFLLGVKPPSKYKSVGKRTRLVSRHASGPDTGILVAPVAELDALRVQELPQVVFTADDGRLHAYRLDKLPAPADLPIGCLDNRAEIRGTSDATRVLESLHQAGYQVLDYDPPTEDAVSRRQEISTSWTFEDIDRRALMKIAFNYLTRVCGKEVALRPEFDATRRFVRHGEPISYDFMMPLPLRSSADAVGLAVGRDDYGYPSARLSFFTLLCLQLRLSDSVEDLGVTAQMHIYDFAKKRVRRHSAR